MNDLRTFLDSLEREHPEEIVRIREPISTRYDVSALLFHLEKEGKFPLLLCDKPQTDTGVSPHPLVMNVFADRTRCARAIGIHPREVARVYTERSERRIPPVVVKPSEAPVKEVVCRGDEVNLFRFPLVWHHEMDPGPYITAGFFTTVDPETYVPNIALQRCWVKGERKTGVWPNVSSDNGRNLARWWEAGQDAPVAVWVGHHPAVYLGGQSYGRLPYGESHYPSIGGLLGEPLRLVPTETHGDTVLVPADAEVVIEGFVPKDHYEAEGPFGESPGYTGGQRPNPVIEVTAVTCRRDAYWQNIFVGHTDNHLCGIFAVESKVYDHVRAAVPEVVNVHTPAIWRAYSFIQVQKRRPGVGRAAAVAALSAGQKLNFVFDEDVDIFDLRQVLWAIATRSQWDRDLIVSSNVPVAGTDPSVPEPGIGSKAALDCTLPAPPEPGMPPLYSPTNRVPREALERVDLEEWVPREQRQRIPTAS